LFEERKRNPTVIFLDSFLISFSSTTDSSLSLSLSKTTHHHHHHLVRSLVRSLSHFTHTPIPLESKHLIMADVVRSVAADPEVDITTSKKTGGRHTSKTQHVDASHATKTTISRKTMTEEDRRKRRKKDAKRRATLRTRRIGVHFASAPMRRLTKACLESKHPGKRISSEAFEMVCKVVERFGSIIVSDACIRCRRASRTRLSGSDISDAHTAYANIAASLG